MDPFTENILHKAELRSKNLGISKTAKCPISDKTEIIDKNIIVFNSVQNCRNKFKRQLSDKENIDLGIEINISSGQDLEVQVEIKEENSSPCSIKEEPLQIRDRNRLQRLGALYSNIEELSSPVHQTEEKFHENINNIVSKSKNVPKLDKLTALADSINKWEDDTILKHRHNIKDHNSLALKMNFEQLGTDTQNETFFNEKNDSTAIKKLKWDEHVINSLKIQGFQRTETSNSKYYYQYNDKKKENEINSKIIQNCKEPDMKLNSTQADSKSNTSLRKYMLDPAEMTLKERLQFFEKNKGEALVPKLLFGIAAPAKKNDFGTKEIITRKKTFDFNHSKKVIDKMPSEIIENKSNYINIKKVESAKNNKELLNCTSQTEQFCESVDKTTNYQSEPNELYPVLSDIQSTDIEINNSTTASISSSLSETKIKNNSNFTSCNEYEHFNCNGSPNNVSFEQDIMESSIKSSVILTTKEQPNEKTQFDFFNSSYNTEESTKKKDYLTESKYNNDSDTNSENDFNYKVNEKQNTKGLKLSTNKKRFQKKIQLRSPNKSEFQVDESEVNNVTLVHTVSFYRKQQSSQNSTSIQEPCRQQKNHMEKYNKHENFDKVDEKKEDIVQGKVNKMLLEVCKQQQIIAQTSQALNLCAATVEFSGSTESVEGERHLLIATHRRQSFLDEIQRLRVENCLQPGGSPKESGQLTIKEITIPLRQEYICKLSSDTITGHHFVCLLKYNEIVIATKTVPTLPGLAAIKFPDVLHLNNVHADFRVTLQVYGMLAQREILPHEVKYHIKQNKNSTKTQKKKNGESQLVMPMINYPEGSNAVRNPKLLQYGFVIFSLREIKRNTWTLNQILEMSPLDGILSMKLNCELSLTVEHRGFLTMFEDLSGFGVWHRRWCYLNGHILSYWKYPDDEKRKDPIGSIDLYRCCSTNVTIAPRDICARLNTILFECHQPREKEESLVQARNDRQKTIIRYLVSADTKEERHEWCAYINKALTIVRTWGLQQQ